ncbi:MAG: hypothetical protein GXP24_02555 [Planctomycetes bacterium]|nr:hypothetical protein [Planctomycetota bacterium]
MASKDQQHVDRPQDNQWDVCPPGELTQMVHRLDASQRRQRTKQVLRTGLISTAVFAFVVMALGSIVGMGNSNYGGISCAFCRSHLAEYQPHVAGELIHQDDAFVASMKTHLENCTNCRGKFHAMYPDLSVSSVSTNWRTFGFAMQPMFGQPVFGVGHYSASY